MRVSSAQVKMRNLGQISRRLGERATKAENAILIFLIIMLVATVFFGVLVRHTPITGKTLWTEEMGRLLLIFAAFWAAGSVEKVGGHFRVDLIDNLLGVKTGLFLQLFTKLLLLVCLGILIWWTIVYFETLTGMTTYVLQWPRIIRAVPLLIGIVLMFTYMLIGFIRIFRRLFE